MASSKEKKPPVLRQKKKAVEIESDSNDGKSKDQDVTVAFKKLRVDIQGHCIERLQDPEPTELNKPKIIEPPAAESDQLCQLWKKSLKNFCFCEKRVSKQGKMQIKYCYFHRMREKQDSMSASSSFNLNLAYAAVSYRPLLHEGRLKLSSDKRHTQVLRSSKLTIKKPGKIAEPSSKLCTITEGDSANNNDVSNKETHSDTTAVRTPAKSSPNADAIGEAVSSSHSTIFAAATNAHSVSFSSLLSKSNDSSHELFKFEGYRASPLNTNLGVLHSRSIQRQASSYVAASRRISDSVSISEIAQSLPQTTSLPRMLERSCSQEARLDESEINVNELAGYFENSLFMPKDMSSMAKMMYT